MKLIKTTNTAISGITMLASCVFAQEASTQPAPEKIESWMDRDSLFIASASEDITKKTGFAPSLNWTGEVWSNVSDGRDIRTIAGSLLWASSRTCLHWRTKRAGAE